MPPYNIFKMKAITISKNLENEFLRAVKIAGLTVELQRLVSTPGRVVYRVTTPGVSQHQLFVLGVYFAQLTISSNVE